MSAYPTTCPFCACGCGFYLLSNNGQLAGVAPSENHPVSGGKLCARGWSAHEATLWGDRLRRPLLRRNGKPEPVPWSEALDSITGRLQALISAGKPVGLLGSPRASNEENYLAAKLARAGLQTNNVDFSYHSTCRPLLSGIGDVYGDRTPTASINTIESCQTVLLVEGDLAKTHPRVASAVMKAVENGAHLITVGYRTTQMARLSSLHLSVLPGDEGEVITGLLAAVFDLQQQNGTPAAAVCGGYESFCQNVKNIKRTAELQQAAEWIVRAPRATFLLAVNGGHGDQSRKDAATFASLAAISGHPERPGSGLLLLLPRSNVRGACDMGSACGHLPGYVSFDDEKARQRLQQLWSKKLPSERGWEAEELLQHVSGLIILADDPPSVVPMGQRAMAALEKIEFLAVLDAFVTPTIRAAHVALPIASFAETEGTLTNMEGRVQRLRAAANPPGEAKAGSQVLAELCSSFGVGDAYSSTKDVLREITQAVPRYAAVEQLPKDGWGDVLLENSDNPDFQLDFTGSQGVEALACAERPYVLVREGSFDWGRDPLVYYSPTLSRDYQSERKLFPNGFVEMSKRDADARNLSGGRRVRIASAYGDTIVPIQLRTDLKAGVVSVPYAFRDHLASVLGPDHATAVSIELP